MNKEIAEREIQKLIREKNTTIEGLTRKQFGDALLQAIECRDFTRHICADTGAQTVTYLPYRREQELLGRLKAIAEVLEAVDNRCLAVDGPVRTTLQEIRETELVKIYKLATKV